MIKMNAMTRAMKDKIQQEKKSRVSIPKITYNKDNTKTVTVEVTPTNIIKVITSKGISPYEVEDQIKDLVYTGGILPNQKKINLSQFTDCNFDLSFNRQEKKENVIETYLYAI